MAYGVIPRTLPSLESTCYEGVIPLTGRAARVYDFHANPRLWPRGAGSILYRSLINVLVVSGQDSLAYMETLIGWYPFVRKGLTICCMGNATEDDVRAHYAGLLRARGMKEKSIERDIDSVRVIRCAIGDNGADIAGLAEMVSRIM